MAGIAYVFTIARVAGMLGEDEDWLHDLSLGMDPEDGHLWVYDANDRQVPAFTEYGIECLRQIIADERKAGCMPLPKSKGRHLRRSPKAYEKAVRRGQSPDRWMRRVSVVGGRKNAPRRRRARRPAAAPEP